MDNKKRHEDGEERKHTRERGYRKREREGEEVRKREKRRKNRKTYFIKEAEREKN
jgi:hypothetical protein